MPITRVIFDSKDGSIVCKMLDLFKSGIPFTLKEISNETGIALKTVERRVTRMKIHNLLKNERLGRRWFWDLSTLISSGISFTAEKPFILCSGERGTPHLRVVTPHEDPQQAPHRPISECPITDTLLEETPHEALQQAPHETPHETPHEAPQSSSNTNITYINSNAISKYLFASAQNDGNLNSSREERTMPEIVGPNTEFKANMQKVASNPKKKKLALNPDNSTPQARLKQKKDEKKVSDYNVTDMRFEFESLWSEKKWKGYAPRWTIKDNKHIRELLDEQGGENTVKYFKYVLRNWEDIQRRYRIQSSPSAAILWCFRSSLLHEALNNGGKINPSHTREYSGDENLPAGNGRF